MFGLNSSFGILLVLVTAVKPGYCLPSLLQYLDFGFSSIRYISCLIAGAIFLGSSSLFSLVYALRQRSLAALKTYPLTTRIVLRNLEQTSNRAICTINTSFVELSLVPSGSSPCVTTNDLSDKSCYNTIPAM